MTSIFISYARNDDEPFVNRLYYDLVAHGFEVWWDRKSMPNRALTFLHEIREAISSCDRLILVVGPGAPRSEYVQAEWRWALEIGKGINPVLRKGDYPLLPRELHLFDTPDFRDDSQYTAQLNTLIRQLSEPLAPMGNLIDMPNRPAHFITQPDRLNALKEKVLVDLHQPIVVTSEKAKIGIHGMGGIGKSVLAITLARDHEIRRAFPDGIAWISLGQNPDVLTLQYNLAKKLGYPGHFENILQGTARLSEILHNKAVLLILDDLWNSENATAFDILGPRCRMVITSRDAELITTICGATYNVQLLNEIQSLDLISEWSGISPGSLPSVVKEVVRECGFLPLALSICGAMVKDGTNWVDLLEALKEADLAFIDHPQGNILKSIKISIDRLSEVESSRLAELVVFPQDEAIPENAIVTLWGSTGHLKGRDARKLITHLLNRALVHADRIAGATGIESIRDISLHDLIRDFLSGSFTDIRVVHHSLVEAYRQKLTTGWASGPDDGYYIQHIAWHQLNAGMGDECVKTLIDQDFFTRCWLNNEYTIKIAWVLLEKEKGLCLTNYYNPVIQSPKQFQNDFIYYLSKLFSDTGNVEASIPLLKFLISVYKNEKNESKLQNILSDYGWALSFLGKLDESMDIYKEQEIISNKIKDLNGLQKCLIRMANIHQKKGELNQAMKLYLRQQKICEEIGNIEYLEKSLGNQGLIYQLKGFPDKAISLYRQQEELCKKYKFKDSLQKSFCNQGTVLATGGDYERALDYFKQQEAICSEIGSKIGLQSALVNQGIICQHYGLLDKALKKYKQQESICEKIPYPEGIQNSFANQGSILFEMGHMELALTLFQKQERISEQIPFKEGIQSSIGHQGEIFLQKKENERAMELFKKQEAICSEIEYYDGLQQSLGNQGIIFERNNNFEKALILFRQQVKICQKIKNSDDLQLAYGRQASIYEKYSQYNKALLMYKKQERICNQIKNIKDLSKCLIHQAELNILIAAKETITSERNKKLLLAKKLAQDSYMMIKKTQLNLTKQYIEPKYREIVDFQWKAEDNNLK